MLVECPFLAAVSMGRRNTRTRPRPWVMAFIVYLELSEALAQ
jgi:hypothetical protein